MDLLVACGWFLLHRYLLCCRFFGVSKIESSHPPRMIQLLGEANTWNDNSRACVRTKPMISF